MGFVEKNVHRIVIRFVHFIMWYNSLMFTSGSTLLLLQRYAYTTQKYVTTYDYVQSWMTTKMTNSPVSPSERTDSSTVTNLIYIILTQLINGRFIFYRFTLQPNRLWGFVRPSIAPSTNSPRLLSWVGQVDQNNLIIYARNGTHTHTIVNMICIR